jgi:hypothetical protein
VVSKKRAASEFDFARAMGALASRPDLEPRVPNRPQRQ